MTSLAMSAPTFYLRLQVDPDGVVHDPPVSDFLDPSTARLVRNCNSSSGSISSSTKRNNIEID